MGEGCEYCGSEVNMRGCLRCGAPQCCPTCCREATEEVLVVKPSHNGARRAGIDDTMTSRGEGMKHLILFCLSCTMVPLDEAPSIYTPVEQPYVYTDTFSHIEQSEQDGLAISPAPSPSQSPAPYTIEQEIANFDRPLMKQLQQLWNEAEEKKQ